VQSAFVAECLQRRAAVWRGHSLQGDPEFEGEFIVESYKPQIQAGGAITFDATLKPASGTAPAWGTVA
jgi:hypothetical protein